MRIAALRGIRHGEQEALVTACQVLQARGAVVGEAQWLTGQVCGRGVARGHGAGFDQAFLVEQVHHTGGGAGWHRRCRSGRRRHRAFGQQLEVQQALRVVVGGAQHLATRQVLEGGGDTPVQHHAAGVQRAGGAQARQRGAVGAQQENGFHQVACCLLDGKGGQLRVVHRSLGHDAVHRQLELLADLRYREFGLQDIAPALAGQQLVAVENGGFSAFDGYVHAQAS